MPKKFGINSKSTEAREKKAEVKKAKQEMDQKMKEDKLWEDDDKVKLAKENRKKEQMEKKQKEKERKDELKRLADEEAELFGKKTKPQTATKKTRAQIEEAKLAAIASMQAQIKKEQKDKDKEIEEKLDEDINPNHAKRDEQTRLADQGAVLIEGSGLDEAVKLVEEEKALKHPEKKVKQAWNEYIDENMQRAKSEYPGLKRSQLLEILHKEFEKSEKNPFNKKFLDYNEKA
ncbi:hypothetical protein SteCoe_36519 [Stentor coeruleus]|uniref:Coiled-coil domain-containing protein n=1 Tax=Stentor coeruleus TaxID=5963 RepID=A0A1R2APW2_9CILI|nr:hypothetical protein SteCoe_36519 [Stentor coeruleus]